MSAPLRLKSFISIAALILIGLFCTFAKTNSISNLHNSEFNDILLETFVMDSLYPVPSLATCAVKCANQLECYSFFFVQDEDKKFCQTHSVSFTNLEGAVAIPGARYYQLYEDWCPHQQGYILNRKHSLCYSCVLLEQDWVEASESCATEGGHLLWLRSQEEADHIKQFLNSSPEFQGHHFAVGIHMTNGRDWTLTNGNKMTFTDWARGEPNKWKENCVMMAWFFNFEWIDGLCSGYHYSSICQIDKTS